MSEPPDMIKKAMKKSYKELTVTEAPVKTKNELAAELKSEGYSFYEWSDPPGAYYAPHSHEYDECICVIDGKMTFYVDGAEYELGFGKKLYLPKGTMHESRNKSDKKVTYFIGELKQ